MEPTQPQFSGDPAHLQVIIEAAEHQDATIWNTWRNDAKVERPNLRGANLAQVVLREVNLQFTDLTGACLQNATITASLDYAVLNEANLRGARMWLCRFEETQLVQADCRECEFRSSRIVASNFSHAQLQNADFERCYLEDTFFDWADLSNASFYQADLWMAFLRFAKLHRTNLRGANLHGAKLTGAELIGCDLRRTVFVDSDVREATIRDCAVYGVSVWGLKRDEGTFQRNLRVSNDDEAPLFVDDIEVAQFIYLLLNNEKIRHILDTITSKVVLILGRFTPERKAILDALREELRRRDYLPVLFDFDPPTSKDVTGTVETLARMARFIIADLTDPSSIPHELATIVPFLRTTPVLPLKLAGAGGYSMFGDLQRAYPWVLKTQEYQDGQSLIAALPAIIAPADTLANELRSRE